MKKSGVALTIAVNATALTTGGALTILHQFLSYAKKYENFNFLIFVSEQLELQDCENIKFIKLNKRSWVKRILWDTYGFKKKIKGMGIKVDKVVSLQNTSLNFNAPQVIYLHQPLPFSGVKWSLFNSNEWKLYLYTHFYSFFIFLFVNKSTTFVVQTNWMKKALIKMHSISEDNIKVIKPDIILPKIKTVEKSMSPNRYFFYPASSLIYKNHKVILQALAILKEKYQIQNLIFQVTFSDEDFIPLKNEAALQNVEDSVVNVGYIPQEEVFKLYQNSSFVAFPSYIETFGLPLAEAASLNKKIICTDAPYSRDVLDGYTNVTYVQYNKPSEWAEAIYSVINNPAIKSGYTYKHDSTWNDFFKFLGEKYV